jgi:maltose alpha-D-glucosyltransferase/alpha-amylase
VTPSDFVFIDFEGEPARSVSDRRLKRPALRDVAGMLRSFAYAAEWGRRATGASIEWADAWRAQTSGRYLAAYLETAGAGSFVPRSEEDLRVLLDAVLVEKALYELLYELNNRPDRVGVPLAGLRSLVE